MTVEALIRPTRDRKPYRLKMRFVTPAFPKAEWVEEMKVKMAERWLVDMETEGWVLVGRYGFKMTGPYPATEPITLPKPGDDPFHTPSKDLLPAIQAGYNPRTKRAAQEYAMNVPTLQETGNWEFQLTAVFHREEILTEIADPHEEAEGRKNR